MELVIVVGIVVVLVAAFVLLRRGRAAQADAGLPVQAQVVYSDTGGWEPVQKPLFSRRYRLTGKPDYIIRDESGAMIPIEVKPNRKDATPRLSDTLQLMAYGVLVEEEFGARPAYGLLKYREQVFRVEFTDELREEIVLILDDMRRARRMSNVARSHDEPMRCQYCGYREACDEKLV